MFMYKINDRNLNISKRNFFRYTSLNSYKTLALPVQKFNFARHYPPLHQEWEDSVCGYNRESIKNSPSKSLMANKVIRIYFNMTSNAAIYRKSRRTRNLIRMKSTPRFFLADADIKQTGEKAVFTVYVYMRENISQLKRFIKLTKSLPNYRSANFINALSSFNDNATYDKQELLKSVEKKNEANSLKKSFNKVILLANRKRKIFKFLKKVVNQSLPFTNIVKRIQFKRKMPVSVIQNSLTLNNYSTSFNSIYVYFEAKRKLFTKIYNHFFRLWLLSLFKLQIKKLKTKKPSKIVNFKINEKVEFAKSKRKGITKKRSYKKNVTKPVPMSLLPFPFHLHFNNKRLHKLGLDEKTKNETLTNILKIKENFKRNQKLKNNSAWKSLSPQQKQWLNKISTITISTEGRKVGKSELIEKFIDGFIQNYLENVMETRSKKEFYMVMIRLRRFFFKRYLARLMNSVLEKETSALRNLLGSLTNKFKLNVKTPFLKTFLSNIFNKKVELNLVNLKYLHLNSEIMIKSVVARLRNQKTNVRRILSKHLRSTRVAQMSYKNIFLKKNKTVNEQLRYKLDFYKGYDKWEILNLINSDYNGSYLNDFSKQTLVRSNKYTNKISNIYARENLDAIKYKWITGVRLEARGRLSSMYGASRARSFLKYKGNLKNLDYLNNFNKKLPSSLILRNQKMPNIQYTYKSSERHIGTFGVKGWLSNN